MKTVFLILLAGLLGCSSSEPPLPVVDGGSDGGSGGAGGRAPTSCAGASEGALCWGERKDRIHGLCLDGECIVTEWGCVTDNDCNDANECTSDACSPGSGACLHEDLPRTHLCSAPRGSGHCNPVDASCCSTGFVEDQGTPGWFICVEACPPSQSPRALDGLCEGL